MDQVSADEDVLHTLLGSQGCEGIGDLHIPSH